MQDVGQRGLIDDGWHGAVVEAPLSSSVQGLSRSSGVSASERLKVNRLASMNAGGTPSRRGFFGR